MTRSRFALSASSLVAVAIVATPAIVARQASVADARLQAALTKEVVEGKCDDAIPLYQEVLTTSGVSRTTAAKALLQMAGCYEKLGKPAEGLAIYQRIVSQHADSGAAVTTARERIAAIKAVASGPGERVISNDRTLGGLGAIRWSPDAKSVIGMRLTASEFDGRGLYLRNTDTAAGRALFYRAPGHIAPDSQFSPDGRRYAALMAEIPPQAVFADAIKNGRRADTIPVPGVLVVGLVDNSTPQRVIDIPMMAVQSPFLKMAWSPDSRSLAITMPVEPFGTFDLQVMDISNGRLRPLGVRGQEALDFQWSPAGHELLVHASPSNRAEELRVITIETGASRPLALPGSADGRVRIVRWISTGEVVVRYNDPAPSPQVEDTYLIDATSGKSRKTCSGQYFRGNPIGGSPSSTADACLEVTADGLRQVVWRHASKRLVVRELATGREQSLTSGSGGEEHYGALSPDDRTSIFVSNRDGRWRLYSAEIARAPVASPRVLSTFDEMPSFDLETWTPDGFIGSVTRNGSNVIRVDVDPSTGKALRDTPERLTQDGAVNGTPNVSPDGKRVVYWTRQAARFGIGVMDSNGANERLLLETAQDSSGLQPTWRSAADIIFTVTGTAGSRRVMSLNVTTGAAAPIADLPDLPAQSHPQYLRVTDEILHLDGTYRTLRATSLTDRRTRVVASFDGDQEVDSFAASPDGTKLAYVMASRYASGRACFTKTPGPVTTVEQITTECEIVQLALATGERTTLAKTPGQNANVPSLISWSPDGRFLLFGGGRPQIIDTKNITRSALLVQATPLNWDRTASWSPDGSFIVLTDRFQNFEWRQWKGVR